MKKLHAVLVVALLSLGITAFAQITGNTKSINGFAIPYQIPIDGSGTAIGGTGTASMTVQGSGPASSTATGSPVGVGAVYNATPPTYTTGQRTDLQANAAGSLLTQLATAAGAGISTATSGGSDGLSNTQTVLRVNNFPMVWNGANWDRQRGDTTGTYVITAPSAASGIALPQAANTAVSGSKTLKASAGNLYGYNIVTGGSAGYLMFFDSTTVPADGAVTPTRVIPVAANTGIDRSFNPPLRFATGIVAVFSTTGPYTKTISATAFLAGDVQ